MRIPYMNEIPSTQQIIDQFKGYNNALQIGLGEWKRTKNLTNDYYPAFSPRGKWRYRMKNANEKIYGTEFYDGDLIYLSNANFGGAVGDKVYIHRIYDGESETVTETDMAQGEKQIVIIGSYMVIFPDGKYFNLLDKDDKGDIDFSVSNASTGVRGYNFYPCDINGNVLNIVEECKTLDDLPVSYTPHDGDLIVVYDPDASDMEWAPPVVYKYYVQNQVWATIKHYVLLWRNGNGDNNFIKKVKKGDTVTIDLSFSSSLPYGTGIFLGENNEMSGSFNKEILNVISDSRVVVDGTIYAGIDGSGIMVGYVNGRTDSITVYRKTPEMDYIIECENRLWGCRYSEKDKINEIYASKLGDFRNWNSFNGISTDSTAIGCGSPGEFTGAVNYSGHPLFFKRDRIHKIYVSSTGAHQSVELMVRGVQKGSSRSIAMVDGTLFYKSDSDVCWFDGTTAYKISDAFGFEKYRNAVAASDGYKYYISMEDTNSSPHLFCYDTRLQIWQHEDNIKANNMESGLNCIYLFTENRIYTSGSDTYFTSKEPDLEWYAESGSIGYSDINNKYIGRFTIRCAMQFQSEFHVSIQYDSDGYWEDKCCVTGTDIRTKSFTIPIIPRRCDHFAIRLSGKGDIKIYSLAFVYEGGSDV